MRSHTTVLIPHRGRRFARLGAAVLAALSLAACGGGGGAGGAPAVLSTSDALQPNPSFERCIVVSEEDERVFIPRSDPLVVGDLVTFDAIGDKQWSAFSFFSFHLALPRGAVIEEATLILYGPAGQQMPLSLGSLVADAVQLGTATEISDVGASSITLATPPIPFQASAGAGGPMTASVRDAVQLAVDEGHGQAQFRVHFDAPWDNDLQRDLMQLYPTDGAHPQAVKPRLQVIWRLPQP